MLRFQFDTYDLPEEAKEFYHSISLEFERGHEMDIQEMVDRFKSFLMAMTFVPGSIEKIKVVEDADIISRRHRPMSLDKDALRNFLEGELGNANDKE